MREVTDKEAIEFILNADVGEKCKIEYMALIADPKKMLVVYSQGNKYPIHDRLPVEVSLIEKVKEYLKNFEKGKARWADLKK